MRFGPYETVRELGRGGASVVYRARGPSGRDVALKLIHALGPDERDRIERERRIHATLGERQGFVPLLDSGSVRESVYLVMPLLEGGTLRDRLKRGPLPVAQAQRLGLTLARAIGRAHALGIVHRDLKPENVLFSRRGEPLVADLGLAKRWSGSGSSSASMNLTATGETRGTIGFMSREQMFDPASVAAPADVFALGALLYECLAGTSAFGSSPSEVLQSIERGTFRPLREHRPEVPPWLARAVERCLAREARDRFEDGAALAQALEGPERAAAPPRSTSARGLRVSLALGLGAALVGAVALVALELSHRRHAAQRQARLADARAAEEEGIRRRARGDEEGALEPLTRAIALDPASARARRERACALEAHGDHAAALADLDRALALDPESEPGWRLRSIFRARQGDLAGAAADVEQALALAPSSAPAWKARGDLRLAAGDLDAALSDLSRSLELDPGVAAAWFARSRIRTPRHDVRAAIADLDRVLALEPRSGTVWSDRGTARMDLGDWEGALADLDRAVELAPADARVFANRGIARRHRRDFAGARADLDRALELEPTLATALVQRAVVALQLADSAAALADLTRLLALQPGDRSALRLLCQAHMQRLDAASLLRTFDELAAVDPALAWARPDAAGDGEAGRVASLAADVGLAPILDTIAKHLVARASQARARGELASALADYRRALRFDPTSADAQAGVEATKAALRGGEPERF